MLKDNVDGTGWATVSGTAGTVPIVFAAVAKEYKGYVKAINESWKHKSALEYFRRNAYRRIFEILSTKESIFSTDSWSVKVRNLKPDGKGEIPILVHLEESSTMPMTAAPRVSVRELTMYDLIVLMKDYGLTAEGIAQRISKQWPDVQSTPMLRRVI
jgi:hypothetical protein